MNFIPRTYVSSYKVVLPKTRDRRQTLTTYHITLPLVSVRYSDPFGTVLSPVLLKIHGTMP